MFLRVAVLAPVVLSLSGAASAQVKELAPGDYQCTAPAGDYHEQEIASLPVGKRVDVRFRALADAASADYPMQASIRFVTPSGKMDVQLGKANNEPTHLYLATWVTATHTSNVVDQYPLSEEWVQVGIEIDAAGIVHVTSRSKKATLNLGTTAPVQTYLHCHSGTFEVQVLRPQS